MERRHATAIPSGDTDLSRYGRRVNLMSDGEGVITTVGSDFTDRYAEDVLIETPGHLGLTSGPGLPASVHHMERHHYTSEAVFCCGDPVILPVAAPTQDRPHTHDVHAILISPGECVILNPGVWHAPCIGVDGPTTYYWFAAVDNALPSEWVELDDGPVEIELVESSLP